MKKTIFICLLIAFTSLPAYAQVAKMFSTKDDNGIEEHLLHHLKKNTLTYFSSAKPNGALLEIKKQIGNKYWVTFPNTADLYELVMVSSDAEPPSIKCTNPDGTVQNFYNPMHTNCYQYGQGKAQETIFGIGPPIAYVYYSVKFPQGVLLTVVGGDTTTGIMKVSFPNDKGVYKLKESLKNMQCTNPDGSVQIFQLYE